jgi:hypothetical protein
MITSFINDLNFEPCCLKLTYFLSLWYWTKKNTFCPSDLGIPYMEMMVYRAENNTYKSLLGVIFKTRIEDYGLKTSITKSSADFKNDWKDTILFNAILICALVRF